MTQFFEFIVFSLVAKTGIYGAVTPDRSYRRWRHPEFPLIGSSFIGSSTLAASLLAFDVHFFCKQKAR